MQKGHSLKIHITHNTEHSQADVLIFEVKHGGTEVKIHKAVVPEVIRALRSAADDLEQQLVTSGEFEA